MRISAVSHTDVINTALIDSAYRSATLSIVGFILSKESVDMDSLFSCIQLVHLEQEYIKDKTFNTFPAEQLLK